MQGLGPGEGEEVVLGLAVEEGAAVGSGAAGPGPQKPEQHAWDQPAYRHPPSMTATPAWHPSLGQPGHSGLGSSMDDLSSGQNRARILGGPTFPPGG